MDTLIPAGSTMALPYSARDRLVGTGIRPSQVIDLARADAAVRESVLARSGQTRVLLHADDAEPPGPHRVDYGTGAAPLPDRPVFVAADGRNEHLRCAFDVIGDVHGAAATLTALLATLGYDADGVHPDGRVLVFVGDLVDRGPDPFGVVDHVARLIAAGRALAVRGNHEERLVRILGTALAAGPDGACAKELRAAAATARPDLAVTLHRLSVHADRPRYVRWLKDWIGALPLIQHLDAGRLVVVHAAVDPTHLYGADAAARRRRTQWALWGPPRARADGPDWAAGWTGPTTVVHGHVQAPVPRRRGRVVGIDTGAAEGGGLTAYRWPEDVTVTVPTAPADLTTAPLSA